MPRYRDFAPQQRLPATWTDAIEELVGNYLDPNFKLERATATTIRVPAGAGDAEISVAIDGKPRWITANVTANHPGGVAGSYPIHITGSVDSFATDAGGFEVDNTTHAFGLKIGAPSGSGAEAISRQVGTLTWDGAAITGIQMDRDSFDAYRRLTWAGDTNLYRSAADVLKSDDAFQTAGALTSMVGTAQQITLAADGILKFGSASDANLYRSAANALRTGGALTVDGVLTASGNIVVPTGGSISSAGYLQLISGASNDQIMFKRSGGATESARFEVNGHLVFGPTQVVGWSAVAGSGSADALIGRVAANAIYTPGRLDVTSGVITSGTTANELRLWTDGRIYFGSALDTMLYRNGAGSLYTPGNFQTGASLTVGASINHNGTFINLVSGSVLQWNADAKFTRTGVGVILADAQLQAVNTITSYTGTAAQIAIGNNSGVATMYFGSANDASLYRVGASRLGTAGLDLTGSLARPLVSALPGSPYDGQEILFQTAAMVTAGIGPWLFRYRSASASTYKWEFIGGAPWAANRDTADNVASPTQNAWISFDANDPSVTVPLAGDYAVLNVAQFSNDTGAMAFQIGVRVGATDPTSFVDVGVDQSEAAGKVTSMSHHKKVLGVSAATLLAQRYRFTGAAGTVTRRGAALVVIPLRVG